MHRKEAVKQRVSAVRLGFACAAATLMIAAFVITGLFANGVTEDSMPIADAGQSPGAPENRPVERSLEDVPEAAPLDTPPAPATP
jgi:hypothetical protein